MVAWPSTADIEHLSQHQLDALDRILRSPLSILTGGPGTGKTHTAAGLLKACTKKFYSHEIGIVAPTGKAGIRVTESMHKHGLYSLEGTTIHRALRVTRNGHDKKGWGFKHHAGNPLRFKVLAIEEMSMLGTSLGYSLFSAIKPGTLVLCLGDEGQLPPVEHGAILRDMRLAGVPCAELTEVRRNAGRIVAACQQIRAGIPFTPSETINLARGENLRHVECARPKWTIRHLERLLAGLPSHFDVRRDLQVLTAIKVDKSELSQPALNRVLQSLLNGNGKTVETGPAARLREGDKVLCTSNGWLTCIDEEFLRSEQEKSEAEGEDFDGDEVFVANGELGIIRHLESGAIYIELDSPRRTIRAERGEINNFDLAYAITTHKFQGCQCPIVLYVSDDYGGARFVASRELIYTALSRAEQLAITIGKKSTIDQDCQRCALESRKTFLAEKLRMAA